MSDMGEHYDDMQFGEVCMVGLPADADSIPVPPESDEVADWGMKLVDLKGIAKPPAFSGDDADWFAWKFRFASVMGLLRVADEVKYCAAMQVPVIFDQLSPQGKQKSTLL